jgi:hypothetical protein
MAIVDRGTASFDRGMTSDSEVAPARQSILYYIVTRYWFSFGIALISCGFAARAAYREYANGASDGDLSEVIVPTVVAMVFVVVGICARIVRRKPSL